MDKPNCYNCIHRRDLPGSAHSYCAHPKTESGNIVDALINITTGNPPKGLRELNIKADRHGFMSGWFMWPFNFDPVWLENCEGFESKKIEGDQNE